LANEGRYEFIATTEAPKPTFAILARRAHRNQTGEEDGRIKNAVAARAPKNAKVSRSILRCGAWAIHQAGNPAKKIDAHGGQQSLPLRSQ
jgi:hypothetical protein